jgi:drug/metabolite transporter (DMT)-like permease
MTATQPALGDRQGRGIALMLLAVLLFVVMDAMVKWLTQTLPIQQIILFRGLGAFIALIPFVVAAGGISVLKTRRPLPHLVRVVIGMTAMVCMFLGFKHLPLADAVTLGFAAPLFMTAMSVPLLQEAVGVRRWAAVIVGFAGVLVMIPAGFTVEIGMVFALAGAALHALALIAIRILSVTENSVTIVFYFTLGCTLFGAAWMPWVWTPVDGQTIALLLAVGILGGLAQMAMTGALRWTPVAVLGPLEYSALVFAVGADILIWSTTPDARTIAGAAIIAASGLYIIHREGVRGSRQRFPSRFARFRIAMAERDRTPEPPAPLD